MWMKSPARVKSNQSTLPSDNAFVNFPLTTVFSSFFFFLLFVSAHGSLHYSFCLSGCRLPPTKTSLSLIIFFFCFAIVSTVLIGFIWMRCWLSNEHISAEAVRNGISLIIIISFRTGVWAVGSGRRTTQPLWWLHMNAVTRSPKIV